MKMVARMSQMVIQVENLSKAYRLGQISGGALTNDLKVWWAKTRGKPNPLLKIGETYHRNSRSQYNLLVRKNLF